MFSAPGQKSNPSEYILNETLKFALANCTVDRSRDSEEHYSKRHVHFPTVRPLICISAYQQFHLRERKWESVPPAALMRYGLRIGVDSIYIDSTLAGPIAQCCVKALSGRGPT